MLLLQSGGGGQSHPLAHLQHVQLAEDPAHPQLSQLNHNRRAQAADTRDTPGIPSSDGHEADAFYIRPLVLRPGDIADLCNT